MAELNYAEISKLLKADFETGKLFWLSRSPGMFTDAKHAAERKCNAWSRRYAGKEAFTAANANGYHIGKIAGRTYLAHRVIWLLHTGAWPAADIDHINGVKADNRITNLRSVSRAENGKNQRTPSTNTSGVIGVHWNNECRKWQAQIVVNDRLTYLGMFADLADAAAARKMAETEYGFHPNHGRQALASADCGRD